jgi:glycosyltransferase involved in cell wall biosynthesis
MNAPSLDIIIPVFNEDKNIEKTLAAIVNGLGSFVDKAEVKIIYDFEEDSTLPVIREIKDRYPFPIELVKNDSRGVCRAIKKGLSIPGASFALVTMADMSDDYTILPEMIIKAQEGYDVICGSRYMKGGKLIGGPFFKQLLSRMAGITLNLFTGIPTHDITNSFKLYKKEMIDSMTIESSGGFEIGLEITAKAFLKGGKIVEIPCAWYDRTEGKSRFRLFRWLPLYLKWYLFLLFSKKNDMINGGNTWK